MGGLARLRYASLRATVLTFILLEISTGCAAGKPLYFNMLQSLVNTHNKGEQGIMSYSHFVAMQIILLLLGLLGTGAISRLTPRAGSRITRILQKYPLRSFAIGLGATALFGIFSAVISPLMHTPLRLVLLLPAAALMIAGKGVLGYGWICSMAALARALLRKLNVNSKSWPVQAALGLLVCFALNVALGSVSFPFAKLAMVIESLLAIGGMGAVIAPWISSPPNPKSSL